MLASAPQQLLPLLQTAYTESILFSHNISLSKVYFHRNWWSFASAPKKAIDEPSFRVSISGGALPPMLGYSGANLAFPGLQIARTHTHTNKCAAAANAQQHSSSNRPRCCGHRNYFAVLLTLGICIILSTMSALVFVPNLVFALFSTTGPAMARRLGSARAWASYLLSICREPTVITVELFLFLCSSPLLSTRDPPRWKQEDPA